MPPEDAATIPITFERICHPRLNNEVDDDFEYIESVLKYVGINKDIRAYMHDLQVDLLGEKPYPALQKWWMKKGL
jgi:hypothetical protein